VVSCPWHGWTLEVRTGLPDHPGERSLAAHEVRVEGGAVSVGRIKSP
jgi:nitrite reductase/ring-hydroxylating ferredoxin subunit